jgi:hypothetical protein
MADATDDRPVMNLGHLALPRASAAQDWLERQAADRAKAVEIVTEETTKWFGGFLPRGFAENFAENFAERVVAALDQRN